MNKGHCIFLCAMSPCLSNISVVTLEYYLLFVISAGILLRKCENFTASFSLLKVCFNFCLSNTIWHYYIIYLPMNKIFQLCFMFSQEIYIKLETLPSRKMKNIFLIFHFPEIPIFVTLFVI